MIALRIYSEYEIHKDARFVIESLNFLGDQYVGIMPTENKGTRFKNGDVAEAEASFSLQEFTRAASGFVLRIDDTAKRLNEALADVRRFVLNPATLTNFAEARACRPLRLRMVTIASGRRLSFISGMRRRSTFA